MEIETGKRPDERMLAEMVDPRSRDAKALQDLSAFKSADAIRGLPGSDTPDRNTDESAKPKAKE